MLRYIPPASKIAMMPTRCCAERAGYPFIERIFADGGYRGDKMARVIAFGVRQSVHGA